MFNQHDAMLGKDRMIKWFRNSFILTVISFNYYKQQIYKMNERGMEFISEKFIGTEGP